MLLLAAAPLAASETQREACAGFTFVPYQGPSCPAEGGAWRVLLDDGSTLMTHGPDYAPADDGEADVADAPSPYPAYPVACTTTGAEHHVQLVYVHPIDADDRASNLRSTLRDQVARANGQLRQEAVLMGDDMVLRFRCDGNGQVNMAVEHLSFRHSDATFSRISSELRSRGYNAGNAKYLVFYDAGTPGLGNGIAGQGSVHMDDRLAADNSNLVGGDFAINYGYLSTFGAEVSLHEMSHNQGAVQLTAPHTSGGWHCNDGRDTMCYSDGGMNASYSTSRCPDRTAYDCGHDTYFNPVPAWGSYLATHWNVGSRYNKFLAFGARPNGPPQIVSLACVKEPSRANESTVCNAGIYDLDDETAFGTGGRLLNVSFDWGDGTTSGPIQVRSGSTASVAHAWSDTGSYLVTASVTDNGSPPITVTSSFQHRVACTFRSSANVLVGLGGIETPASARTVAIPCDNQPFRLTGNAPNDFDVCWYAGDVRITCNAGPGNEAGIVPPGATHAHVVLRLGVNGAYNLWIDAP